VHAGRCSPPSGSPVAGSGAAEGCGSRPGGSAAFVHPRGRRGRAGKVTQALCAGAALRGRLPALRSGLGQRGQQRVPVASGTVTAGRVCKDVPSRLGPSSGVCAGVRYGLAAAALLCARVLLVDLRM